jgi:twitching motility protein PilT
VNLGIQWFVYNITGKKLMTQHECNILTKNSDENISLSDFAQKAFDKKSELLGEVNAKILLDRMETVLTDSIQEAAFGVPPPDSFSNNGKNLKLLFSEIPNMPDEQLKTFLRKFLLYIRNNSSSDLHFSANSTPFIRHVLKIEKQGSYVLTADDAFRINTIFLTKEQADTFVKNKELTYALSFDKDERYRVALMNHKDGIAGTYHLQSSHIKSLEELGFKNKNAKTISTLLNHHNGLILLAGPIGSGKTTTLASLVNIINFKRYNHVIMIEDPIEIVQKSQNSNITQREIITHTASYAKAVKGALREDPDVIVIGELNDLETIELAITASEAGHLVIGTLPTDNSINTLNRIVDVFPPSQQPQIRTMISGSLCGIVCQKLLPTTDDKITVACEILVNNLAVSNTISTGKHHLLKPILQASSKLGMCTMDESIFALYKDNIISGKTALKNIKDNANYKDKITISD